MRKLGFMFLRSLIIALVIFLTYQIFIVKNKQEQIYVPVQVEAKSVEEVKRKVIEKEVILDKIKSNLQIVGLTGTVQKLVKYDNDKWYGKKSLTMQLNGTCKLGYDLSEILTNPERVIINNSEGIVTIVTPDIEIISLELPYDKAVLKVDDGWLRKELTDQQKQGIYEKARLSVVDEIMKDKNLLERAKLQTNEGLKLLLSQIDGVKKINFVN